MKIHDFALADQDWIGPKILKNLADEDWIGFNFIGSGLESDWKMSQSAHLCNAVFSHACSVGSIRLNFLYFERL